MEIRMKKHTLKINKFNFKRKKEEAIK